MPLAPHPSTCLQTSVSWCLSPCNSPPASACFPCHLPSPSVCRPPTPLPPLTLCSGSGSVFGLWHRTHSNYSSSQVVVAALAPGPNRELSQSHSSNPAAVQSALHFPMWSPPHSPPPNCTVSPVLHCLPYAPYQLALHGLPCTHPFPCTAQSPPCCS